MHNTSLSNLIKMSCGFLLNRSQLTQMKQRFQLESSGLSTTLGLKKEKKNLSSSSFNRLIKLQMPIASQIKQNKHPRFDRIGQPDRTRSVRNAETFGFPGAHAFYRPSRRSSLLGPSGPKKDLKHVHGLLLIPKLIQKLRLSHQFIYKSSLLPNKIQAFPHPILFFLVGFSTTSSFQLIFPCFFDPII